MSERHGDGWSGEIGGNCPVQGDGRVDEKPWYFRARGGAWSFEVADDPLCSDANWVSASGEPGVMFEEDYDGDAGWMDVDEAWRLVEEAITRYRISGGNERRADGIGQLYRCLQFARDHLETWAMRFREGDRDPVAAAWAESTFGTLMEGLLEIVAESKLGPGHPRCRDCPSPDVPAAELARYQRALADHLRAVVTELPALAALVAATRDRV
ncbi:Hypothetical protein A7982_06276 [Minicystis rosea]|nr:Hypothetical protein A7982_06276 [Minicystis rosea]